MNEVTAQPKPPIAAGGALAALAPQSLDDYFRLSQALGRAGDMVPKHFQGNPEMIMAALIRGAEIGLMPMQALSNIAVINGRASIWGDAMPAIIQRAGHHVDVEVTGEGDSMVATATLTRGDTGKVFVRTFSVDDAKAAGLLGKAGPWQNYKKRMLGNRARTYAIRDGAADAMMGMITDDEAAELPPIRDVTPQPTRLEQKIAAARAGATQPAQEASDPITGEVMDAEPAAHWTASVHLSNAFPGSKAFTEGADAFKAGGATIDCPYDGDEQAAADWLGGFDGARRAGE